MTFSGKRDGMTISRAPSARPKKPTCDFDDLESIEQKMLARLVDRKAVERQSPFELTNALMAPDHIRVVPHGVEHGAVLRLLRKGWIVYEVSQSNRQRAVYSVHRQYMARQPA